jgi:hypothetical protein
MARTQTHPCTRDTWSLVACRCPCRGEQAHRRAARHRARGMGVESVIVWIATPDRALHRETQCADNQGVLIVCLPPRIRDAPLLTSCGACSVRLDESAGDVNG